MDHGWNPLHIDQWLDPSGSTWHIDYKQPGIVGMCREILSYHFTNSLWSQAARFTHGLEGVPDLVPARKLLGKLRKSGEDADGQCFRKAYWMEAVVQGAMEFAAQHIIVIEDGVPVCTRCGKVVKESPWQHVSYYCDRTLNDLEDEVLAKHEPLVRQAQLDLDAGVRQALWLRGLCCVEVPDPFEDSYLDIQSYEANVDIEGCIVGGDGSTGHGDGGKDCRTRRCGFGLYVLRPSAGIFTIVGYAMGSVPGSQTVPRSEMAAILHTLRTTSGNAVYVCDNQKVASCYNKGTSYEPRANGLFWHATKKANLDRISSGRGSLEVIWIKAHKTIEHAISNKTDILHFVSNHLADIAAKRAANQCQLPGEVLDGIRQQDARVEAILERLTHIAISLVPHDPKRSAASSAAMPTKHQIVMQLARMAGHRLNTSDCCISCGIFVDMRKSLANLETILHMKCMGRSKCSDVSLVSLPKSDELEGVYMLHSVPVQSSHAAATHAGLKLHFCTYCGAFAHLWAPSAHKRSQEALPCQDHKIWQASAQRYFKWLRPVAFPAWLHQRPSWQPLFV